MRLWDLGDSLFADIKMQLVIGGGQVDPQNLMDVPKNIVPETPMKLCGKYGKSLSKTYAGLKEEERKIFANFFHFVSACPGMQELWGLVEALETEAPSTLE